MRQIIEHIQKSIYGPAYYQELLSRSLGFSWKYFSALALLLALFLTIIFSVPLVPMVIKATREFPPAFFTYYPDELEVRIDKGIASSNVVEPYFLPLPDALQDFGENPDGSSRSLLVIDTTNPFSLEQWTAYNAFVWLGKEQIAFIDDASGVRIEPFDSGMDLLMNEQTLRDVEAELRPFYKFAAPAIVLGVFIGLLISLGINFIYLLFGAAAIFVVGLLMKQKWSFSASYRLGLHAITLPLLIQSLIFGLIPNVPLPPFLFTVIMLGVVFVNFKNAPPAPLPLGWENEGVATDAPKTGT